MADVDRLLLRLRPLIPDKIAKWSRARETGDAELRSLIDRRVIAEAHRRFGDREILLSLPPKRLAHGPIELGTIVYDRDRGPLGLFPQELMQNTLIAGRSGAGKTVITLNLLAQMAERHIPFLLLDIKHAGRRVIETLPRTVDLCTAGSSLRPFPFNPFLSPPGVEPEVYANRVVDVLAEAFTLGAGAQSLILRALREQFAEGVAQVGAVVERVQSMADNTRSRGWKATAVRALESVAMACGHASSIDEQHDLVRRLLTRGTILELDNLGQGGRRFLASLLCLWLYSVRLASPERDHLKYLVFAEEGHYLFNRGTRARETVMEMLLRQGRELGLGMVVTAQNVSLLSPAVLGNIYTTIILNTRDAADLARAAALVQVEDKAWLARLPVGHGVVRLADRWRSPVLVRFPMVRLDPRARSDAEVSNSPAGAGSGPRAGESDEHPRVRRGLVSDQVLGEDELALLEDVDSNPDDGVKGRYRRLAWSGERGTRIKARLVRSGWLEGAVVPVGNTRKLVLRLSQNARASLGLDAAPGHRRESVAHEYWKRWWARHLEDQGYQIRVEAPRKGGYVDVLGIRGGETVAVEVETGWADYLGNVRDCLRSGYTSVIVVATSAAAAASIERALAEESLLLRQRVEVLHGPKR